MKIGLGTVQFGLNYGVTNPNGIVSHDEGVAILELAGAGGVRVLDTAAAYGDSESALGTLIPESACTFEVVTKTVPLRADKIGDHELQVFRDGFARSLNRLRTNSVSTLLVHYADDLLVPGGERLYGELLRLLEAGQVRKIGFSAYDSQQVEVILDRYKFSVVQLPVSVFDQRLIHSGTLEALGRMGVEVHARSVFLQGLLLQNAGIPAKFARWSDLVSRYHAFLTRNDLTPLSAAIGFVARQAQVGIVLLGVTTRHELDQCLTAYREDIHLDFAEFSVEDFDLIDPRRWAA